MASILDRYGIKEVADVTLYEIKDDGTPGAPVLYFDTLKASTIETTAETTYATGGKGNANLVAWDYGKEITLALEDALFSAKSMSVLFGDGKVSTTTFTLDKVVEFSGATAPTQWLDADGTNQKITGTTVVYDLAGSTVTTPTDGGTYFLKFQYVPNSMGTIEISADKYPGTYYMVGDTFARSATTGKDEYFQFIVPKAKMSAESTITLEAEGDPSVFSFNMTVLRPDDGVMMKLVKYGLSSGT